ncbi:uracil DNA glycosylase [Coemansia brasiliensis]|uniref:Uracil-DNA glycosylase n=1 Tax=Coemansia brasiliensis TaxID=2650707 RepID=A0A9W8LYX9_9FUNG|nr:uracil DNA glycosylase [Coemansia brasiliensis]
MAEYVQVLERLRSLAMEWTEQYEEIMARSHHIEYLFSNLDKLNSASANSHLIFQQHKQIQSQLRQIYKLLGPLTRTLKALAKLHEQAHDLDEEEVVDKVQRISGITREYVKECVSHVYETSLKETRRVMMRTKGKDPETKPANHEEASKEASKESTEEAAEEAAGEVVKPQILSQLNQEEFKLELETIEPSWLRLLQTELPKPYFKQLKKFLAQEHQAGKQIFPPAKDVYSWSRFAPFRQVRVVILGQDPYHGPGQAHGLAFSVQKGVRTPPSLLNMYKALEGYQGFSKPDHGYLGGWAEQGVLLLNASLTVECHKANSHANKGWELFTDRAIELLNQKRKHVVFMLWGSYAQKKGAQIDKSKHLVLKAVHPSPLSAHRGFFECRHFEKANDYLAAHGLAPIDWSHLP